MPDTPKHYIYMHIHSCTDSCDSLQPYMVQCMHVANGHFPNSQFVLKELTDQHYDNNTHNHQLTRETDINSFTAERQHLVSDTFAFASQQFQHVHIQCIIVQLTNSHSLCLASCSPLHDCGTASDDSHPTSHKHTDHWTCVLVALQGNTPQALLHSGSDDPPALYPGHCDQAIHSHMSYLERYWNTSQLEMHCKIMDESYDGHHNKHTEQQVFQ